MKSCLASHTSILFLSKQISGNSLSLFIIKRSNLVTLLILILSFLATSFAQEANPNDTLKYSGNIPFWTFGEAELFGSYVEGEVNTEGAFTLIARKPRSTSLSPIREFDGVACLQSTNPDSKYTAFSTLAVFQSDNDKEFAELYFQTPRFNFNLDEAYVSFHYYSEATTVSGRCVSEQDNDFDVIYNFPDLEMKAGWNQLAGVITDLTDTSDTYTFRHTKEDDEFAWELEALSIDSYVGVGANISYPENGALGILISEVDKDSPAQLAGLETGDIIVAIDDTPTKHMPVPIAVVNMRGEEGTKVVFSIMRNNTVLDIEVVRQRIN